MNKGLLYIPEQKASLTKVKPAEHKHWKLPGMLLHICSQPPFLSTHSSISGRTKLMLVCTIIANHQCR